MTYYYKTLDENGKLIMVGTQHFPVRDGQIELTEAEYNSLLTEIKAHAEAVQSYVEQVKAGEITLDDVPEDCKEEVEAIINQTEAEPSNPYGIPDETVQAIKDDTVAELIELGVL